jgi:hypothetical protein
LVNELKSNPVVTTLRSIGFEVLSGFALRSLGYEGVELGRIVPWNETARDVDAFGFKGDELRVLECKAYHRKKSVSPDDVTKFFTRTVPSLKKWLRGKRNFSTCTAEIWSAGPLGTKAREALYGLPRPKTDHWKLLRHQDIEGLLPESIKRRGIEILRAIALEKHGSESAEIDVSTHRRICR